MYLFVIPLPISICTRRNLLCASQLASQGCHGVGKSTLCESYSQLGFRILDEGICDAPSYLESIHPQSLLMETMWVCNWYAFSNVCLQIAFWLSHLLWTGSNGSSRHEPNWIRRKIRSVVMKSSLPIDLHIAQFFTAIMVCRWHNYSKRIAFDRWP